MKMIGTRRLLAGAIGLLILMPGIASAQTGLSVEATSTDDNAPPHNILCSAESTQVFDCRIWSPSGAVIERARPTTDGVSLLDISQVTGADTNMALAVVVGGAGSSEITQQRMRNSLAVALQGIGAQALVAATIAGGGEVDFGPNSADMQRALINQTLVTDADALSEAVSDAIDALSDIEGRPRALVVAGSASDEFSNRDISRLSRRLRSEGIALTVLVLPSQTAQGTAAIEDLPFANVIDTRPVDGALTGPQIGAFPAFVVPTIRLRLSDPTGSTGDGVDLAAQFADGSRTEFRVSQGDGGIASIGRFGSGVLGALDLLPRGIGMAEGMRGRTLWIIVLVLGGLIALYGLVRPRERKEAIDVASLRQMRMAIEDAEVPGAAPPAAAIPVTEATEATDANTAIPDDTATHIGGHGGGARAVGSITFAGSGRVETLGHGVTRIGRLGPPDNDIMINESHVSRRHAEIFVAGDGRVGIRNLTLDGESQSRRENPIFVNGTQIQGDTILSDGDEVRIAGTGDTRFRVSLEAGA
jgi:pSer/pThr/pTyr-binding forkhead associated (FHA) protein